jgi:phage anti-repressor protein
MVEYGFVENQDFEAITQKRVTAQGNETTFADHAISLDMAKEISMIQRTDKGKEARRYFIECERQLREEKLSSPTDIQSLNIDNVPIEVPTGIPFSVSRSKTGVITVRVKETAMAKTKPVAKPSKPAEPPPPMFPSPGKSVDSYNRDSLSTRDVTLMGVHLKAANKLLTFMKQCRGHWIPIRELLDKKSIIPMEFRLDDLHLIINALVDKNQIVRLQDKVRVPPFDVPR